MYHWGDTILLTIIIAFSILSVIFYPKFLAKETNKHKIIARHEKTCKIVSLVLIFCEAIKIITEMIADPREMARYLPLHLCSFLLLVFSLYAWIPNKKLKQIALDGFFCIGTILICGLIFAPSLIYFKAGQRIFAPGSIESEAGRTTFEVYFYTIYSFLYHGTFFVIFCTLFTSKLIYLDKKDIKWGALCLAVLFGFTTVFGLMVHGIFKEAVSTMDFDGLFLSRLSFTDKMYETIGLWMAPIMYVLYCAVLTGLFSIFVFVRRHFIVRNKY